MEVIPSIDLLRGKCVRLYQGDYSRETVFAENPVEAAARWQDLGATRLHVVDLDGAKSGAPANLAVVKRITSAVEIPVQVGGGIRALGSARDVMAAGASRVLFGTAAVANQSLVAEMCDSLGPEAVVVSVDAKAGYVAVKGWTETTTVLAVDLIKRMEAVGVQRFVYTDIARDGTLTEPNFDAIEKLAGRGGAHLMVAGGVSSVRHLLRLVDLGVEAAIIGRAVYTGDIDLLEAIEAVRAGST